MHGVDVNLDDSLDRLADKRALGAPSCRSSLPVLSVASRFVARRCPFVSGSGACGSNEIVASPHFNVDPMQNTSLVVPMVTELNL